MNIGTEYNLNPYTDLSDVVFTVIHAPAEAAWNAVLPNLQQMHVHWSFREGPLDISSVYGAGPIYAPIRVRSVLWSPDATPYISALVVNLLDGWQWLGTVLSTEYNIAVTRVDCISSDPLRRFTHNEPSFERVVQVIRDSGRWQFVEKGPVLPFEETSDYSRPKGKRLSKELLGKYLTASGWNPYLMSCWRASKAYYAESSEQRYATSCKETSVSNESPNPSKI